MLQEMSASGRVSVQSHTVSHAHLDQLNTDAIRSELQESARTIAEITGKEPLGICYPYGGFNNQVLECAKEYYTYGVCIKGTIWHSDGDPVTITRREVSRKTTLSDFAALLRA